MNAKMYRATNLAMKEMERTLAKWGEYPTRLHAIAVIREEYLELEQEVFHGEPSKVAAEAIQLASASMILAAEILADEGL